MKLFDSAEGYINDAFDACEEQQTSPALGRALDKIYDTLMQAYKTLEEAQDLAVRNSRLSDSAHHYLNEATRALKRAIYSAKSTGNSAVSRKSCSEHLRKVNTALGEAISFTESALDRL